MKRDRKINKINLIVAIALFFIIGTSISVSADWANGKISVTGQSSILTDLMGRPVDHETGEVISIAEGGARAYERAKDTAFAAAVAELRGLRVDNYTLFSDLVSEDPIVRQRLSALLDSHARYREVYVDYLTRGCILEINTGDIIRALNYNFPEREFPLRSDVEVSTLYTSLIIDTRGLGIKPMLLPVIYNESGLEIYSKDYIIAGEAVKHNPVSYVYNEKEAMKHRKAGRKPFFTSALRKSAGSPVISDEDIKRVFSDKKNLDYLRRCRVIFIIDR